MASCSGDARNDQNHRKKGKPTQRPTATATPATPTTIQMRRLLGQGIQVHKAQQQALILQSAQQVLGAAHRRGPGLHAATQSPPFTRPLPLNLYFRDPFVRSKASSKASWLRWSARMAACQASCRPRVSVLHLEKFFADIKAASIWLRAFICSML